MEDRYTTETHSMNGHEKSMSQQVDELLEYIDNNVFFRIINKLTDYAEILTEGKLSGLINYNYNLNSSQTNTIIDFLISISAISRIYNIALKGAKDLETEYVSNIFSDVSNPGNISSYLSLRNILENRLSHQTQQYNMNMGKNNTTMAMPLNELRGHVKTFNTHRDNELSISTKAQHGIIAASLHDAYITIINRTEYWNDRTYMKFFFSEDEIKNREMLIVTRTKRLSLEDIDRKVKSAIDLFANIKEVKSHNESIKKHQDTFSEDGDKARHKRKSAVTDKMLMTPFGRQYGAKIDSVLDDIFSEEREKKYAGYSEDDIRDKVVPLFELYSNLSSIEEFKNDINDVIGYLLFQDYGIRTFIERFLYTDKRIPFNKFYNEENKERIELFLEELFTIYFYILFNTIFRIIKSGDMKKFACAFIMKRIYINQGDHLSSFGFFFIKIIARIGGIKTQM